MFGSGDAGAEVAARLGLGFVFAHHMNPDGALEALAKYRAEFRPSPSFSAPAAALSIGAIAAESDDAARTLASSAALSWMRFAQGYRDLPLPSVEEALAHRYTEEEAATREARSPGAFVGSAARVRDAIEALAGETQVDEVLLLTHVHSAEARRRSYSLLAEAFRL
jgi:luciferase family oxidoreductase group 1